MSTTAQRLRAQYEYARTHRVFDLDVMLEAAALIEELEAEREDVEQYYREHAEV